MTIHKVVGFKWTIHKVELFKKTIHKVEFFQKNIANFSQILYSQVNERNISDYFFYSIINVLSTIKGGKGIMKERFTKPLPMPRGTHYGNNYWIFQSRKLHRRVTAFSNLEYENLLCLEMDSNVQYYCEQPYEANVFIGAKEYKTIFDVWVKYTDSSEEFQEVKYSEELEANTEKGERDRSQVAIQKAWCLQNEFQYTLKTDKEIELGEFYIRNLNLLSAKARRFHIFSDNADKVIINYLAELNRTTIGYLISSGRFEPNRTLDYLADLYYRGIIIFTNIENECISNKTEVIFNGYKKI